MERKRLIPPSKDGYMQKASRWLLMAFAAFTLSGCQEKMPTADDIDLDEMFDSESSDDEVGS